MEKKDENRFIIGNVVLDFSEKTINITCPDGHLTVLTQSGDVIVRKDHYEWEYYFIVDTTTPNVFLRPFPPVEDDYAKKNFDHSNDLFLDKKNGSFPTFIIDQTNPHIMMRPYPILLEDDIEHLKEIEEKDNIIRSYIDDVNKESLEYGCPPSY